MAELNTEKQYALNSQLVTPNIEFEQLKIEGEGGNRKVVPSKHPMQISNIVQNLLKFIPKSNLGSQRLVSGLWNVEAKFQIRRRITFRLSESNLDKIETFVKFAESSLTGFQKFDVDLGKCYLYHRYMGHIDNILMRHAALITHFTIGFEQSSVWKIQNFRNLLLRLNPNHLKSLAVRTCPSRFFEVDSIFPPGNRQVFTGLKEIEIARVVPPRGNIGFFSDLFHSAPNLEFIDFNGRSTEKKLCSTFEDGIDALIQVRPENLKHVRVRATTSNADVMKLIDSQFDLQVLHLFHYRLFDICITTTAPPIIHPLALNYGETYCVTLVDKLSEIMREAFRTEKLTNGNKVSCLSQLRIFQSTLNNLLIP